MKPASADGVDEAMTRQMFRCSSRVMKTTIFHERGMTGTYKNHCGLRELIPNQGGIEGSGTA